MKRFVALVAVLLVGLCSLAAAQNRTYTIEDLLKVRRVGDPQVSPDGKRSLSRSATSISTRTSRDSDLRHVDRRRRHEAVDHGRSFINRAALVA